MAPVLRFTEEVPSTPGVSAVASAPPFTALAHADSTFSVGPRHYQLCDSVSGAPLPLTSRRLAHVAAVATPGGAVLATVCRSMPAAVLSGEVGPGADGDAPVRALGMLDADVALVTAGFGHVAAVSASAWDGTVG